ncbi:MAG: methyltransferase domain-containing protein [Anaerolineae bacterium]|nr:methyltransferase domain-containing protein [Anaerolineae bacterium]
MSFEYLGRLRSVLAQLPVAALPHTLLNVGCGEFPSAHALIDALPGWRLIGVDLDGAALRRAQTRAASLHLLQADAIHLPDLLRARAGLILVRHPDLYCRSSAWSEIISMLPRLLAPGGSLIISVYVPEEIDLIRSLSLPPAYPLDEGALSAPDLAGHDRFVLAYRRAQPITPRR